MLHNRALALSVPNPEPSEHDEDISSDEDTIIYDLNDDDAPTGTMNIQTERQHAADGRRARSTFVNRFF